MIKKNDAERVRSPRKLVGHDDLNYQRTKWSQQTPSTMRSGVCYENITEVT